MKDIKCKRCGKKPHEIKSVVYFATDYNMSPEQFIETEEGTYNEHTRRFYCDECYIALGMPLGKA